MKFLIIGLFLLTSTVFASETKVCVITTDVDSEKSDFFVETKEDGSIDSFRIFKEQDGRINSNDSYPAERSVQDGIVASERQGRNVVILKAEKFSLTSGGTIVVNYLYNGITNSRANYRLKLAKMNGKFVLLTSQGQQVNRIHFLANRAPVIGLIGIKEVKASFVPTK